MGQKKTTIASLLVQLALAALVVVLIYNSLSGRLNLNTSAHRIYAEVPMAWHVRCWSDALFIPAVLWLGMGGMLCVATTDFFDIFRYAFSSLLVLFSPLKNPKEHKHFYEYKLERAEKRKGKSIPTTVLALGAAMLLGALALSFVHEGMVADVEVPDLPAVTSVQEAAENDEEMDEAYDADLLDGEEINDTTGGEENE